MRSSPPKKSQVPVGILTPSLPNDPNHHDSPWLHMATATWTSPFKTARLLGQQCPSWKPSWNRCHDIMRLSCGMAVSLGQLRFSKLSILIHFDPPKNPNNLSNLLPGDQWLQYSWPSQRNCSGPNAAQGHPTACCVLVGNN